MLGGSNAAWDSTGWESLHEGDKSTIWDGADQKWQGGPASASPEKCPRAWIGSVSGRSVVYAPNEGFSLCIVGNLNRILTLRGVHVRPSLAADLVDMAKRVSEYVQCKQRDAGPLTKVPNQPTNPANPPRSNNTSTG